MDQRERAKKDIDKLERILKKFTELSLNDLYPSVFEYAINYWKDAVHFYEEGDHFTAFGAANYAYGFIDAVLIVEGKKDEALDP